MNTSSKFLATLGGLLVLGCLSLFLLVRTYKDLRTPTQERHISFSGIGKVVAKPDVAVTNFSIVTEGKDARTAQDENSRKSQAVTAYLKGAGIEDKDTKTSGYSIYPLYTYYPQGGQKITGYQVSQTFTVKIRNLDSANKILDGIVNQGVNQVSQINFEIDDIEKIRSQARKLAIDDAKAKARELSRQLGISLGTISDFSENINGGPIPRPYYDKAVGMGGGSEVAPGLPAGENEIESNVSISYTIN